MVLSDHTQTKVMFAALHKNWCLAWKSQTRTEGWSEHRQTCCRSPGNEISDKSCSKKNTTRDKRLRVGRNPIGLERIRGLVAYHPGQRHIESQSEYSEAQQDSGERYRRKQPTEQPLGKDAASQLPPVHKHDACCLFASTSRARHVCG